MNTSKINIPQKLLRNVNALFKISKNRLIPEASNNERRFSGIMGNSKVVTHGYAIFFHIRRSCLFIEQFGGVRAVYV